ncbi:hypothetical protein EDB89DRAFT_1904011 [Lactarius sanguifluus]|nr:hypothetical protein EDB89DRAFT_1904011 [Lactarius sanguifluus]
MHVRYSRVRERNWAALSGIEIALSAAIGWGQRRGDLEHAGTSFTHERSTKKRARSSSLGKKEGKPPDSQKIIRIGKSKNEKREQRSIESRNARAQRMEMACPRYEKRAKSFEDKQGLGGSKERDERTEQTERRAARGKSTGKDFFQPRTRASIHETYGFSARLMGTDTRGPIQWELLMMLCWRERPASGYELGELLLATGVVAGNNFGRAGAEWRRGQGRSSVCAARQSFMLHHGTILRKREKDALLGVYSVQCLRLHRAKGSGRLFSPLCYGQRVQVQYRTDRRKRSGNADERHQTAISIAEDLDEPVPEKASEDMERRQGGLGTAERAI